jgi:hypothetical protein
MNIMPFLRMIFLNSILLNFELKFQYSEKIKIMLKFLAYFLYIDMLVILMIVVIVMLIIVIIIMMMIIIILVNTLYQEYLSKTSKTI